MSCKKRTNLREKIIAGISLITAVLFLVSTPTLVKAENRSNRYQKFLTRPRDHSIQTSKAFLKAGLTKKKVALHSEEIILSEAERKMISSINQERAKAGLKELEIDLSLVRLAKEKSRDMVIYNYFGHNSARFGSIYDQLEREGIVYQIVAENLAGTTQVHKAHQYFMGSPTHRCNILNARFTKIGVGVIRGGPYGAMITQLFLG